MHNTLLSLSLDGSIRLWDLDTKEQSYEFNYQPEDRCLCVLMLRDNSRFLAGFEGGSLRIFGLESASVVFECQFSP